MSKFLLTAFAILFFSSSVFPQSTDLIATPDSLGRWYAGQEIPKNRFKLISFIAPVALSGYGFAAIHNMGALQQLDLNTRKELQEDHPLFVAHVDNYLQFAPAAALYALNFSGFKGKHNLFDATMLYVTANALMVGSTHFVKQGVGRLRPNGIGNNSFPSGHTASAFTAAEFLHQEYKHVNPWIGYAGYFVATATGALRMYNNKHWFSDVVAGAGFGIASTKISYLVYPYIKSLFSAKQTTNLVIMPMLGQGDSGLMLSAKF